MLYRPWVHKPLCKSKVLLNQSIMGTKNKHIIEPGTDSRLVADILQIINNGRDRAYAAINISMVETYWNVGRRIVQEEQKGELRAEYGTQL